MMRVIFWVLLGTVILSAVPFGSIYPWSYTLLALIVGVLVLSWAAMLLIRGEALAVPLSHVKWPAILFGATVLWAFVQATPWTPETWHNPVWAETARVLGRDVQGYISVDPFATVTGAMRLLTYAGIFWLALQFGRDPARARLLFQAIAIAGLIYGGYGLAVELTDSKTILWYRKERYWDSLTATFRYKNAYATYAGLGILCTVALLVHALSREDLSNLGPRETAHTLLSLVFGKIWYLVLGFVVMFSALLLSDSRGGFLFLIVALIALVVVLRLGPAGRRMPFARSFTALMAAAGTAFVALSGGKVLDRLESTTDNTRIEIYSRALDAIGEHPVAGWGLGTFEGVFAKYQGPELATRTIRAHNEYLDNALGLGIPVALALFAAVAYFGGLCLAGVIRRQRDVIYPATGFSATLLAAMHATVDFTFQTPAVTVTFVTILGVAAAQSWNSDRRRRTVAD